MQKRKYNPSPETQQAEQAAHDAGFIRASEACEVLGILPQHMAAFAEANGLKSRKVGRENWYKWAGIINHLDSLARVLSNRRMLLGGLIKGDALETATARSLLKSRARKRVKIK